MEGESNMMVVLGVGITLAVCGLFGSLLASDDKKPMGFFLGLFFGPLGVLISAIALKKSA